MDVGNLAQVALALAFIVVLVIGLGFAMRRINGARLRAGGDIEVVASTFLGPKERIVLLKVQDRRVLVGISAQTMTALGEFPDRNDDGKGFAAVLQEASR
ncbi:MAG: flagellar biosynthetic protein FliO [Pseudomonadales bacterium]